MVRYINGKDRPTEIITRAPTCDGSTVGFTITQGMTEDKVIVTLNGVTQSKADDFSISGTTLTMVVAPESTDDLVIREMSV
jgi:hypothetical protein